MQYLTIVHEPAHTPDDGDPEVPDVWRPVARSARPDPDAQYGETIHEVVASYVGHDNLADAIADAEALAKSTMRDLILVDPLGNGEWTPRVTSRMNGEPILTMGELRKITDHLDDDVQVIIGGLDGGPEWLNVGWVVLPEFQPGTTGYLGLTLCATDTFDTRQW